MRFGISGSSSDDYRRRPSRCRETAIEGKTRTVVPEKAALSEPGMKYAAEPPPPNQQHAGYYGRVHTQTPFSPSCLLCLSGTVLDCRSSWIVVAGQPESPSTSAVSSWTREQSNVRTLCTSAKTAEGRPASSRNAQSHGLATRCAHCPARISKNRQSHHGAYLAHYQSPDPSERE